MTNPSKPLKPIPPFRDVRFLDPAYLFASAPDTFRSIYGKTAILYRGTPVLPEEYILVDDESELSFLRQGEQYRLITGPDADAQPIVKVQTYRYCGGKALVLLVSNESLTLLNALPPGERIATVPLNPQLPTGSIRPGGGSRGRGTGQDGNTNQIGRGQDGNTNQIGRGQDGNTNQVGRGQGYPNAVGFLYPGQQFNGTGLVTADTLHGSGPTVAILDSGLQLAGGAYPKPTRAVSCQTTPWGWDFVEEDADPTDEQFNRHGTRVAGIIRSVCPEANLLPVRIADARNVCTLFDVLSGLEYAAAQGARIINASWVFACGTDETIPLLQASLQRLAYRGILVVCAAGNVGDVPPAGLPAIPAIGHQMGDLRVPMLAPACSSAGLSHVITVTSVVSLPTGEHDEAGRPRFRRTVCELKSDTYVSVGVLVNGSDGQGRFGSFKTPDITPDFRGTSFAAPYVTGLIARAMLAGKDLSSREAVLRSIGARRDLYLLDQIVGGLWVKP
ncbi:S8 family peptidase [Rudanella paleaurantiibacter]|uniref:S8 family peptidase n=1 Tax=Rudanella paleaurantiibacter TaxID=2614655 RepID=UPI0016250225|nr:S8/S53 family peptidase [Rudanella paleaurantiibacter]